MSEFMHDQKCEWNGEEPSACDCKVRILEYRLAETERVLNLYKQGFNEHLCTSCENCCGDIKERLSKENDALKAKLTKVVEGLEDLHRITKCYCKRGLEPIGSAGYCTWCEAKQTLAAPERSEDLVEEKIKECVLAFTQNKYNYGVDINRRLRELVELVKANSKHNIYNIATEIMAVCGVDKGDSAREAIRNAVVSRIKLLGNL